MVKKSQVNIPEEKWNPESKELWHLDFEKEPVNDEKWSCLVATAVQSEAHDEECIKIYNECVATGCRQAIKKITMSDVIKLLRPDSKENKNKMKENLKEKKLMEIQSKTKQESSEFALSEPDRIIQLAAKYAKFSNVDCQLPPDLMALVLKSMILSLKHENCHKKKVEAAKAKIARQEKIKADFVKSLKPYEIKEEDPLRKEDPYEKNSLGLKGPILDEPFGGPDLYILLSDFYDPFYFIELLKINVPVVAFIKVCSVAETTKWSYSSIPLEADPLKRKNSLVNKFWDTLNDCSKDSEKTNQFKNIAMLQYQSPISKKVGNKFQNYEQIFDEISWMLYSLYIIYRQHQSYLQKLYVQRIIVSLEPLDLRKCEIYNKLCDALVTGEPSTPMLVLYSIVEQVVAGVPHTNSISEEYESKFTNVFDSASQTVHLSSSTHLSNIPAEKSYKLIPPCEKCRLKLPAVDPCEKLRNPLSTSELVLEKTRRSEVAEETNEITRLKMKETKSKSVAAFNFKRNINGAFLDDLQFFRDTIKLVLWEKTNKSTTKDLRWKNPSLYFYEDFVGLQTYHCDPRLLDSSSLVDRFLKNADLPRLWMKYPELPPEEKAFYSYQFFNLWKISGETQDLLKLKIFFAMAMKLIGISKSYLFRGEDENTSELSTVEGREKMKKLSKVRFDRNAFSPYNKRDEKEPWNYFSRNFTEDAVFRSSRKPGVKVDQVVKSSIGMTDSHVLRKLTSQFNMYLVTHRTSGASYPLGFKHGESFILNTSLSIPASTTKNESTILQSFLDCYDISNLVEPHLLSDKNEYLNMIKDFNFFERLEPARMVQRLLKAQEKYNTVQCSHFAPTDTLIIIMHNDFDYRGIFSTYGVGTLFTPVAFRDFYNFVYPEITGWLSEEQADFEKFQENVTEKAKKLEEKKDQEYTTKLKNRYFQMCEGEKQKFLESESRSEIVEEDLEELPTKPKYICSDQLANLPFVSTNLGDLRVENVRNDYEYYSKDGTQVTVTIDYWLADFTRHFTLMIKLLKLQLIYHKWLKKDQDDTTFSVKTNSDITMVFSKEVPENKNQDLKSSLNSKINYFVNISWPTGLMIQPVFNDGQSMYLKQGYIEVYRRGWDIEEEKYRCYIKNGQILIFKEDETVEVLSPNGERYSLLEFVNENLTEENSNRSLPFLISKYNFTNAVGEVWEKFDLGHCKSRKRPTNTYKIYIGVDLKTHETYYIRDDGVSCMLWPSGKLVTKYSDGTKITTTPDFDQQEILVEWTEEEKSFYTQLEKNLSDEMTKSMELTTVETKNSDLDFHDKTKNFWTEGFVSVSCSYLMEHPKYATVTFQNDKPYVLLKMFENLSIKIYPEGNYEVEHEGNGLNVYKDLIQFYTECSKCEERSMATLRFTSNDILCHFVDFFHQVFQVHKNGQTTFQESQSNEDRNFSGSKPIYPKKSYNYPEKCCHLKNRTIKQRCFALERDYTGYEFLHADALAYTCYDHPLDTYYQLNIKSADSTITTHTFTSPFYKVGFENWVMKYEDNDNCLPANLKKHDLKEQGAKENVSNLFKYCFPKDRKIPETRPKVIREKPKMPKVVITRTVNCLSQQPKALLDVLHKHVTQYQKKAHHLHSLYQNRKALHETSQNAAEVNVKLLEITRALNRSKEIFPHMSTRVPSTEKDIHYFGHFINFMEELHADEEEGTVSSQCKQIRRPVQKMPKLENVKE